MQRVAIIAAMSENKVIGLNNRLPWHLPADWENFRRLTVGKPFLMGRKSFESPDALLSNYRNIIISSQVDLKVCGRCELANSVEQGFRLLENEPEIFILGGERIFAQTIHRANYLYLTIVHHIFKGDAFFPDLNWAEWQLVRSSRHEKDERHDYPFSLNEYRRL